MEVFLCMYTKKEGSDITSQALLNLNTNFTKLYLYNTEAKILFIGEGEKGPAGSYELRVTREPHPRPLHLLAQTSSL